ncbi:MAG: NUDIX domain-containing protein [Clostridia bacterium]|nr:NUDIX domain-containing protein [Clostridia bacterium]
MRLLFVMDANNYAPDAPIFERPSVRGVMIREGKIALVHSLLFDYYKFAGGGAEPGEDHVTTLCREVREEVGLVVKKDSIRPFGRVLRKEKRGEVVLVQQNYYYLCEAEEGRVECDFDDYEREEGFTLEWVDPKYAILTNRTKEHGKKSPYMIERESKVLEILIEEGYFD